MFIPSNERAVGREMSNPQVTCGGDIKKFQMLIPIKYFRMCLLHLTNL